MEGEIGLDRLLDRVSLLSILWRCQYPEEAIEVVPGPPVHGAKGIQIGFIQPGKLHIIRHIGKG